MLLNSKDVSVTRKNSPQLNLPDLQLEAKGRVLVLGPSGSGKTTLLSVLAGLLQPTTGTVLFEGKDIYSLSPRARDHLRGQSFGFVFQSLHLLPALNLRQNIALAADMADVPRDEKRLDHLLDQLGLSKKAHRKPEALSQGEQQRAAIARAVLNRPKIIIADEPTSALDDRNTETVLQLLDAQARESGAALLIATHDNRIIPHFKNIVRLSVATKEAA